MDVLELLWSENPDTWSGKLAKYGAASWGRYIFRALTAADAFFWNSAKEGRAWLETSRRLAKGDNLQTALGLDAPQWAAAQEQAAEELKAAGRGSRTADIDRRAMEIVEAGREADITHEARKWAAHATYNYDSEGTMGVFAAGMNLITKHFPPARAVVPFVRIVANMTDVNLDWTPIGLLRAAKGSHLWNMKSSGGRIVAGEKFSPRDRAERAIAGAVGTLALVANVAVAGMLYAWREGDANMRSVWLCSRNDALGNLAVMGAAAGVFGTGAAWPDLLVAAAMAALAISGGWAVLRQARAELRHGPRNF